MSFRTKPCAKWQIDLAFGHVMRVKSASEGRFNLLEPRELADRLAQDEAEFWELLWYLVEPQAQERKVSAERFGESMAADCLHEARRQFFAEWDDFFLQLHRPDKRAVVEKVAQYLAEAMALVQAKIAAEGQTLDAKVTSRMERQLNATFGDLLASLDATPGATPGGSSSS